MSVSRCIAVLMGACALSAWAAPIDPQISIDSSGASIPITVGQTFVTVNGGGVFDFENDTGQFITDLSFDATINSGILETLPEGQTIADVISCSSGFFLTCGLDYNDVTGALIIHFSAPGEPLGDVELPCDTEATEQEGIPVVQEGCPLVGHFLVNLNDPDSSTGSWNTITPGGGQLGFQVSQINSTFVPEPSSLWTLGATLLALAGIAVRRVRRPQGLPARLE